VHYRNVLSFPVLAGDFDLRWVAWDKQDMVDPLFPNDLKRGLSLVPSDHTSKRRTPILVLWMVSFSKTTSVNVTIQGFMMIGKSKVDD